MLHDREKIKLLINKPVMLLICFALLINLVIQPGKVYAAENPEGEFHAFYPSNAVFSEQMKDYIDPLDSVSFAWSRVDAQDPSVLNTVKGMNGNKSFYYPKDYLLPIEYAKSKGKSIQLNIYMGGSGCTQILPNEDQCHILEQTIVNATQSDITQGEGIYYDGVVIDFEGLRDTNSSGSSILYHGYPISVYYTQFLTELKEQLDLIGKKLYVAVNPKLYFNGYDYAGILGIADRVIIMAHDYDPTERLTKSQVLQYSSDNVLQPINSLAPILLVRQALNDMQQATSDPTQLSKVWLQISFDSAQWQYDVSSASDWEQLPGSTLSREKRLTPLYKSIKARVDNTDGYGQKISSGYNNELQSPYLEYYNSNDESWNFIIYEDSNSVGAKIDLAKAYGLGGISVWSLANLSDYNDANAKKYHLDIWPAILSKMASYDTQPVGNNKYVSFKDLAVEQCVREKLGKPNGKITVTDVQSIFRLKLTGDVKSLKDITKLSNLEYLDASQLGLKDISSLKTMTKLKVLYLQRNSVSDISPLSTLNKLTVLSLNGNKISDLKPLNKLASLQELYLKENKIKSVTSLKNMVNLQELYLSGNLIKDYSPLKKLYSQLECDFKI